MGSVSSKQPSAFQSRSKKPKVNAKNNEKRKNLKRGMPLSQEAAIERSTSIMSVTESDTEESPFALTSKKPIRRAGLLEPIPLNQTDNKPRPKVQAAPTSMKERNQLKLSQPARIERNISLMSINSMSSFNETPRPRAEVQKPSANPNAKTVHKVERPHAGESKGKENRMTSWSTTGGQNVLSPRAAAAERKLLILERNLTVMSFKTDENIWSPRQ